MKAAVLLFVVARLASALDSTCDNLYRWNPQAVYNFNTECKTHCPDGKNPPAPPDMLPDYCRFESCSLRIAEPMTTKVVDYPTEAGCQYSCQVEAYQANFGSGSGCLGYFYDAATKKCGRHIDGEVDLSPGTTIYGPTWCKDPTVRLSEGCSATVQSFRITGCRPLRRSGRMSMDSSIREGRELFGRRVRRVTF
eukprot:Polyplicarium_translucidae@DN1488_c0_g1_i4.p1